MLAFLWPSLISFRPNGKSVYQSLEDDRDRRVLGTSTKVEYCYRKFTLKYLCFPQYVMIDGKFDLPDDRPGGQMVEGKYTLAPLYHVKVGLCAFIDIIKQVFFS